MKQVNNLDVVSGKLYVSSLLQLFKQTGNNLAGGAQLIGNDAVGGFNGIGIGGLTQYP